MVAFNKTEDNQAVIQTGISNSSRGLPANDAFGELFKGLGQTLNNTLTAYDEATRTKISLEATDAVDSILSQPDMSADLQKDLASVDTMRSAKRQGAMPDVEFNTKLVDKAKSLRQKYPGYQDVIDRTLSGAAGSSLANDLRRAQLAEQNAAQANLDAEERARRAYFDGKEAILGSEDGLDLYKKKFGRDFDPATATLQEMQYVALKIEGHKGTIEMKKAQGAFNKEAALEAVTADTFEYARSTLFSQANPLFKAYQTAFDAVAKDGLSDEERAQLIPLWQTFKADAYNKGLQKIFDANDPAAKLLTSEQRKVALGALTDQLESWESILKSPTKESLQILQDSLSLKAAQSTNELLKQPTVQLYKTILDNKLMDQAQLDNWASQTKSTKGNKSLKEDFDQELATAAILSIASGKKTLKQSLDLMGQDASPEAKRLVLTSALDQLKVSEMSPEQAGNLALQIFDPESKDILEKYSKENRIDMFKKFVNPEITNKLKGTVAYKNYVDWAENQFSVLGKEAGKLLINTQKVNENDVVTFDGESFSLNHSSVPWLSSATQGPVGGVLLQAWEANKTRQAVAHVNTMNQYIQAMKPIWEEQGIKPADAIMAIIGSDPTKYPKEGNLYSSILNSIPSFLGSLKEKIDKSGGGLIPSRPGPDEQGSFKNKSLIDFSRHENFDTVKVTEAYGPGRPGRPSATIRDLAQASAADTGMSEIKYTSGLGNTISAAGKRRGQKTTMHSTGKALDVAGFSSEEEKYLFIENAVANGAKGIGVYSNGSVHIDLGKERHWDWGGDDTQLLEAIARGKARRKTQTASN